MSENKAVLAINAIVNKEYMAELPDYLANVMQVFGKNGGKPVARYKTVEPLIGEQSPEMLAVIEFPNADTIKNMINGEDFQALAEVRARIFTKLNMMTCASL